MCERDAGSGALALDGVAETVWEEEAIAHELRARTESPLQGKGKLRNQQAPQAGVANPATSSIRSGLPGSRGES